jgi:hypothetical protein
MFSRCVCCDFACFFGVKCSFTADTESVLANKNTPFKVNHITDKLGTEKCCWFRDEKN